jgi:hypothetical protein
MALGPRAEIGGEIADRPDEAREERERICSPTFGRPRRMLQPLAHDVGPGDPTSPRFLLYVGDQRLG